MKSDEIFQQLGMCNFSVYFAINYTHNFIRVSVFNSKRKFTLNILLAKATTIIYGDGTVQ